MENFPKKVVWMFVGIKIMITFAPQSRENGC